MTRYALAQSFCQYEVTAIIQGPSCGLFGPAPLKVFGLNDLGQVCGEIEECALGPARFPFVWSEETGVVILPFPEGTNTGRAVDINNVLGSDGLGQVVCRLSGPGVPTKAYLYSDGEWTLIPPEPANQVSVPAAMNDAGQVAGSRHVRQDRQLTSAAFRWEDGVFIDILPPPFSGTNGNDINEFGDVVGSLGNVANASVGFLWQDGIITEIPALTGGTTSEALAVNNQGVVVGYSRFPIVEFQQPFRAWVFEGGKQLQIHVEGFNRTQALDVNDAGQITLYASSLFDGRGFLWQDGTVVELRDLFEVIPPLQSFGGIALINNAGQLAGTGSAIGLAGVILTPVDRLLGDVNIDCAVNERDLMDVLRDWGPCPQRGSCLCDIVSSATFAPPGDGVVDGADLAVVLGNWTGR